MLNRTSIIVLTAFCTLKNIESFTFDRIRVSVITTALRERDPSHQDYYDAEEAAAWDAHDISDAGVEAAMMETAVMMAHEMTHKKATIHLEEKKPYAITEEEIFDAYEDHCEQTVKFQMNKVTESSTEKSHLTVERFQERMELSDE